METAASSVDQPRDYRSTISSLSLQGGILLLLTYGFSVMSVIRKNTAIRFSLPVKSDIK